MATRAEVLAAYASNPKATLTPTEDAIQFWMQGGLGNFNQIVDQVRAENPTLASQIDKERAATGTSTTGTSTTGTSTTGTSTTGTSTTGTNVTGSGATDNSALYRQIVSNAYSNIGRKGFGTGANQIDQSGFDFWLNALQNGTLTPDNFNTSFNNAVGQYVRQNPTDTVTQYVQQYKPFQNTGLLTQQQMQPQSMGAQQVPNYQPASLAQNFENYMGIPIGAQYNPGVTAGGASPYSQIRALSPQMVNPYAGVVSNTAMGGYNPMLYSNIAAANLARNIAAQSATSGQYDGGGSDSGATAGGDGNTGGGPGTGAAGDTAYARGGIVNNLMGHNPPGPDDGMGYLDRGEYVVKQSAVNKYGRGLLDMINEGKVPAKKIKSLLD